MKQLVFGKSKPKMKQLFNGKNRPLFWDTIADVMDKLSLAATCALSE